MCKKADNIIATGQNVEVIYILYLFHQEQEIFIFGLLLAGRKRIFFQCVQLSSQQSRIRSRNCSVLILASCFWLSYCPLLEHEKEQVPQTLIFAAIFLQPGLDSQRQKMLKMQKIQKMQKMQNTVNNRCNT